MRKPIIIVAVLVVGAWIAVPFASDYAEKRDQQAIVDDITTVPDLPGLTMDVVYDRLKAARLTGHNERGGWGEENVAISTKPVAGTVVKPGTVVEILQMEREELDFFAKPMPDLIGDQLHESEAWPAWPYFVTTTQRKARPGEEGGRIVEQKPPAGTALRLGQVIELVEADYSNASESGGGHGADWSVDIDVPNVCRRTKWC